MWRKPWGTGRWGGQTFTSSCSCLYTAIRLLLMNVGDHEYHQRQLYPHTSDTVYEKSPSCFRQRKRAATYVKFVETNDENQKILKDCTNYLNGKIEMHGITLITFR